MNTSSFKAQAETTRRVIETLDFNLGQIIVDALNDDSVQEILLNPDQNLWLERFGQPMQCMGQMPVSRSTMVLNTVAAALGVMATKSSPIIEGELPVYGCRFEGLLPPVVASPTFAIRKKATKIFTFADYIDAEIMSGKVGELLEQAITSYKNILVVGGTGSGKTTFVNAIIQKLAELCPDDRLTVIEDTMELQSSSKNTCFLRSSIDVTMNMLLRATMRLRPDRILVGEVRGGEALTLLKSWNTGHPGGVATIHANSSYGGLTRLEQLIAEATAAPMQTLIGEAVDIVINIAKTTHGRKIKSVIQVDGFDHSIHKYNFNVLYEAA